MSQCRGIFGVLGVAALLSVTAPVVAEEAESRVEVLERIKPIGEVSIVGQPVAIAAPEAASADGSTPAEGGSTPATENAQAAADSPAPAAAPADGAALYAAKGCAACHGPDGSKTLMPTYPKISGQAKGYLLAQMKDIKSGARGNGQSAIMLGIISQVSDAEMDAIAGWLSSQ